MAQYSSNKTIAQNTLFLYFRMALTILIGLYTSRVILHTLGVEDFGIYNIAGSVVALFGFLNGALAQSSSRYITIELGKSETNGIQHLKRCFTTTRTIHAILAGLIFIVCETIGLWILCNKCEIPSDRLTAAIWTFQFSTLTAIFAVTQVPFTALIIAHEQMKIYAYAGVIEACLKLIICFCLLISPIDMLVFYAMLLFLLQAGRAILHVWGNDERIEHRRGKRLGIGRPGRVWKLRTLQRRTGLLLYLHRQPASGQKTRRILCLLQARAGGAQPLLHPDDKEFQQSGRILYQSRLHRSPHPDVKLGKRRHRDNRAVGTGHYH